MLLVLVKRVAMLLLLFQVSYLLRSSVGVSFVFSNRWLFPDCIALDWVSLSCVCTGWCCNHSSPAWTFNGWSYAGLPQQLVLISVAFEELSRFPRFWPLLLHCVLVQWAGPRSWITLSHVSICTDQVRAAFFEFACPPYSIRQTILVGAA